MALKLTIQPPLFEEIATTADGRDITEPWMGPLLQPRDPLLRARGLNWGIYDAVLTDDQVKSCFQQRRLAVVSKDWVVEPGDDSPAAAKAAEELEQQLGRLDLDRITDRMLHGVFWGHGIGECIWKVDQNRVHLADVRVRKARRFRFDPERRLRLLTMAEQLGEVMPERKFWTFETGADNDDEPYGLGLAHWLYWPVYFKKGGVKAWLTFMDKFASPTVVGKHNPGAAPEERDRLLAAAKAAMSDSAVVIPEGMVLELMETARSMAGNFELLPEYMDKAISKVVLSQTMTTDDGSSKAQGEVHMDVAEWVVKSDADLVCGSFTAGPARWWTDWNYGPEVAAPRLRRLVEPEEDLGARAEKDQKIKALGFEPDEAYVKETYGPHWKKAKPVVAPRIGGRPGQPSGDDPVPEFAAAPPDAADILTERLRPAADQVVQGWVEKARAILDHAGSLEEARDELLRLAPDLEPAAFAGLMEEVLRVSAGAGVLEAERGA